MAKSIGVIMLIFSALVRAETATSLDTGDAFKRALEQFKPGEALSGFTSNPPEASLNPTENNDGLKNQGLANVHKNETSELIYTEGKTRTKVIANPNSPEMQYAEHLIEGSDTVKLGGCYEAPPICTTNITAHTCEENVNYKPSICRDELHVQVKTQPHQFSRKLPNAGRYSTFNLSACLPGERNCSAANLIHLSTHCESIAVTVTVMKKRKNMPVSVTQIPTCDQLNLTLYTKGIAKGSYLNFTVTERLSEDVWNKNACTALRNKSSDGSCILEKSEPCLEPNATKIIEELPINRACWGAATQYQCIDHIDSTCTSWINQGCKQTTSSCVAQNFGVCTAYSQAFECQDTTCVPQPDICMPSLPCTDGSCDATKNEESHDMNEGVSRLGALAGVAGEVSTNQIGEGMAKIFAGSVIDCKSYPLGFRDCCTDSGWGDWVKHCPSDMQVLQKAKDENRVVSLGKYRKHKLDLDYHHVYCVFPSKLSAIIQKEGRNAQLHIPFGKAKSPDCRGITPQELERINFDKLNLSPIEQELMSRLHVPDAGMASNLNQAHIERLHQEGRAHD